MLDPEKINAFSVDEFVSAYLSSSWVTETDDPMDDLLNILKIASFLGGGTPDFGFFERSYESTISGLIRLGAEAAATCCPARECGFWGDVLETIFVTRYGGTTVYIKRKKSLSYDDVKHLTPAQIMEKHGVSRAYAYRLLSKK